MRLIDKIKVINKMLRQIDGDYNPENMILIHQTIGYLKSLNYIERMTIKHIVALPKKYEENPVPYFHDYKHGYDSYTMSPRGSTIDLIDGNYYSFSYKDVEYVVNALSEIISHPDLLEDFFDMASISYRYEYIDRYLRKMSSKSYHSCKYCGNVYANSKSLSSHSYRCKVFKLIMKFVNENPGLEIYNGIIYGKNYYSETNKRIRIFHQNLNDSELYPKEIPYISFCKYNHPDEVLFDDVTL
jgi:hypothetical protein